MATEKKKKNVKVRDLKPSKDAKGGGGHSLAGSSKNRQSSSTTRKNLY